MHKTLKVVINNNSFMSSLNTWISHISVSLESDLLTGVFVYCRYLLGLVFLTRVLPHLKQLPMGAFL